MGIKKILLSFLFILFALLVPNKIRAVDIDYCSYDTLKLTLPVTIGVEITGINASYPFDSNKNYYYKDELFVYNEATCNQNLNIPYMELNSGFLTIKAGSTTYYVNQKFHYFYNGEKYNTTTKLGNGVYSLIDTTPPIIKSNYENAIYNMEKLVELDVITMHINSYDSRDGNVIPEVIYDSYTDNYNLPGNYSIIFKACDSSNNCTTYTHHINVVDMTPPTIIGPGVINSYMSNPLTTFQIANKLSAIDNYDGDITASIYLANGVYNINYPGIYYLTFNVKDSHSNYLSTPYKVTINYIDDISPTIEGPTSFNSLLSNPLETKDIIANLIAIDNIDNNVIKNMYIVSDTYSKNMAKIGDYKIIVSCYDSSGNDALPYIININVIDDVIPTLEGLNSYTSYLSNPITISSIKNKLIAFDNHDGNINHKIEIFNDNYSLNLHNIGIYTLSFKVNDMSGNTSNILLVEITNIDDILPVIDGTTYYQSTVNEKININTITNSLKANDNVDGDISSKIELNENDYSVNYNKSGTYYITYYVCDKSGNISLPFKIKISVTEKSSFINSINNNTLYFDNDSKVDTREILEMININQTSFLSITTLEDTYSNNYKHAGEYKIVFEVENQDYTKEYLKINIIVHQKNPSDVEAISYESKKKKETIFSQIIAFFKNTFNNVVSYISNLFRR